MTPTRNRVYDHQGLKQNQIWNREKKAKDTRRIFRFLILIFVAIVTVTLLAQIPQVVNKLRKPFSVIPGKFANLGQVNLDHRTNILLVNLKQNKIEELGFVSLSKGDRKAKLIKLNANAKMQLNDETMLDLNSLVTEKSGKLSIDKLEASLVKSLGYIFDSYLVISTDGTKVVNPEKIEKLFNYFYSPSFFWGLKNNKDYLDKNLKTNLTLDQITSLTWFCKSLTPDRVKFIDLSLSLDSSGLFDGQIAKNKIGLLLTDSEISAQEDTVEIQNAGNVAGVGNILKNVITNLGGNVLQVSKGLESEETKILVRDKNSKLAFRLETILGVKMKQDTKAEISGDIKIVIGNDYAQYFNF